MNTRRLFLQSSATLMAVPAFAATVWPDKPLKIIVPFPPGGTSDVIARLITVPLSEMLKTNVIVENKTGDPALLAGRDAFAQQMDHLAARCRANKPIDRAQPVRLPGDSAARSLASARDNGITYDDATWSALAACAREHAIPLPEETR